MKERIGVVGAGRMGRGIALSFAFAGVPVLLIDLKERSDEDRQALVNAAIDELRSDLNFLATAELVAADKIQDILGLIEFASAESAQTLLMTCTLIFEGVPEVMDVKRDAFAYIGKYCAGDAIVASTTSTFVVTDLAALIVNPERFVNAHWLNPAHLMPLIEVSRGDLSSPQTVEKIVATLESIGKVPIVCSASPGYIVPRIQCLAMSEAARLVEEGVASAEDVDKAVKYGFGLRFAVLGLLEFIDWGGGDILYYGSNYLSEAIDPRFKGPQIVADNMKNNRNGLRDGKGFYDYKDTDVNLYREQRLRDFIAQLRHSNMLPVEGVAK
jgi:3-hydroxybutyryl-CoA dehydrogenase